ncbi:SOS response-associated peptidase [Demequina sp.]|uniref:SOS response-associated peptidase n=1 Tax=Demequina sp. TaxID=2050685 RepID=UPI0025BE12D8|nr:SOS response-associated peptidase [Demequina sp.]
MCGRYADFLADQDLADAFALAVTADDERLLPPSYNVAPMQRVRVIRQSEDARTLEVAKWGLVPSWAKDPAIGSRMINARVETIAQKPSFRTAFSRRRCIVPASGYYEWRTDASGKQPFFIHPEDDAPLAFAGLVEAWRSGTDDEWLITCAIVTTAARGDLQSIHDRQPVMMGDDAWRTWLDPASGKDDLLDAAHADAPALAWHEVDKAVGNVRNNSPELVEPSP